MPVEVTRMIASVGSSIVGSGTVSTRTSWVPCQATAFTGTGPAAESPPLTVSYSPLPQFEQGGRCVVEPTWSSLPQLVHL